MFSKFLTPLGAVNKDGNTPLGDAVYCSLIDVVKYFVTEHGVSINGEFGLGCSSS